MYDRRAFKRQAKKSMGGGTQHYMLVALVYWLLTAALSLVINLATEGGGVFAESLSGFLYLAFALFSAIMAVGYTNYALRLSRGQEAGVNSLFYGFSIAGRSVGVTVLVELYIILWCAVFGCAAAIPASVLVVLLEAVPVLAGGLFIIIMVAVYVLAFVFILRYSMALFALVDDPNAGVREAIRRSVRIMRGKRGKFLGLVLSFIGWGLLILLINLVILTVGFWISGAEWVFEAVRVAGSDPEEWMLLFEALGNQLWVWTLVAELAALPLTLWLSVYMRTSMARFFNYAGGYDYFVRTQAEVQQRESGSAAAAAGLREFDPPAQQPGPHAQKAYYNPVPDLTPPAEEKPEEPVESEHEDVEEI